MPAPDGERLVKCPLSFQGGVPCHIVLTCYHMETILEENEALWELFDAMSRLQGREEYALFFRDLCTMGELTAMAERWQVARLVAREIPYREIHRLTGVSTATITRIAHWLRYGEGGYRLMVRRLAGAESSQTRS